MYKYVNSEDKIWQKIEEVLPKDNNNKTEEKLLLINAVLYLLQEKQSYHSQLHWRKLENDGIKNIYIPNDSEGFTEIDKVNINSLRRKFDRWRRCGIWETILPIFDNFKKYTWITEIGRYEVFLICSHFACAKHKIEEYRHELNKKGSETRLMTQDKKICEQSEMIEQQKELIKQLNNNIYELKNTIRHQTDCIAQLEQKLSKRLKGEPTNDNMTENNMHNRKMDSLEYNYNQALKLKDKYIRKLLDYGYNPSCSKRENIDVINDFRDYLKRHPRNRHNKENIRSDDE